MFDLRRVAAPFLVLILAGLAPRSAHALVHFDFEQRYFMEPGVQDVLDHCLLQVGGVYHLFYLRGNPAINIGHATSPDLVHWTLQPPVLTLGDWDNKALWAPQLFPAPGGGWFMYFAGVNTLNSEQIGMAYSSDLYNWFQFPWPVYHPDPAWAEWSDSTFCHGRDPDVIQYNGKYYLFATAKTWTNQGAVACATSSNLITWQDQGPIYVHNTWHVLESVFVMKHANKFHMFFTEEAVGGTSDMASDSLGGWDISQRRLIDLGHAPQVTTMADGTEIFSRHSVYNDNHGLMFHTIRLDTLQWVGDIPVVQESWGLSRNWVNVEGNAFTYQPTFGNNQYARGENVTKSYEGLCWIGTRESYTGPMGYGVPGSMQGDDRTGKIRSRTFQISGRSMNLLVGGTDDIDSCYVALVEDATGKILYKETGKGVEEMDRRYWDLVPYADRRVHVEIVDMAQAGHINVDDIVESTDRLVEASGTGKGKDNPGSQTVGAQRWSLALRQNTPNPFNPVTTMEYELPSPGQAVLDVYDVNGRLVRRLVDARQGSGVHRTVWDGRDGAGRRVSSGVYFYRLTFDGAEVATRKMILLK